MEINIDLTDKVNLYNQIIENAFRLSASDIHLNPEKDGVKISYRVGGNLIDFGYKISFDMYKYVTNDLRKEANVNQVSHTPQDGRIEVEFREGKRTSLRFASVYCGMYDCDKITIRLTDKDINLLQLDTLSFDDIVKTKMKNDLLKNFGLFLVTGPTGSGKTTTLYAALNYVKNSTKLNILTVEDPVEFPIEKVVQIEPYEGVSFNATLESFLRHDPDVIMVGEIRSAETAELAVRAALTGHLVVSTLHANTALLSVTRLMNLGIDSFNLVYTLAAIENQRLVKILCPKCRIPHELHKAERGALHFDGNVYKENTEGCKHCVNGVVSRDIIYEYIEFTPERQNKLFELITNQQPLEEGFVKFMKEEEEEYYTLGEKALEKLRAGDISIEEYYRFR